MSEQTIHHLILTGDDLFLKNWKSTDHFLGPWCFIDNKKFKFWNAPYAQCIPSYIKDEDDLIRRTTEVLDLADRLVKPLTKYFNQITQQSRSERYWKTIATHWLTEFLTVYYDRYCRLENASQIFANDVITVDSYNFSNDSFARPESYEDYYFNYLYQHRYNLFLFSDFFKCFGNIRASLIDEDSKPMRLPVLPEVKRWLKPKQILANWLNRLTTKPEVFLGNIKGLDGKFLRSLNIFAPGIPRFKDKLDSPVQFHPEPLELKFSTKNQFEEIVAKNLSKYIPLDFFLRFPHKKRKTKVFIGSDVYDHPQKFLLADVLDQGGKWIGYQHGGTYGVLNNLPQVKTEYFFGSGYVTWGWKGEPVAGHAFLPMPSPYLSELKANFIAREKTDIFYVSTAVPLYTYRFDSCALPERQITYFRHFEKFASLIGKDKIAKVKVKSYHYDFNLDLSGFYEQFLSSEQVIKGRVPFVSLLGKAKLIINDNLHTSFLESFALNVPTLLFIHPEVFPVTQLFEPWLKRLTEVKVFHANAESLTAHLDQIWSDPESWWSTAEVQAVVKDFAFHFARSSPDWKNEWKALIDGIESNL